MNSDNCRQPGSNPNRHTTKLQARWVMTLCGLAGSWHCGGLVTFGEGVYTDHRSGRGLAGSCWLCEEATGVIRSVRFEIFLWIVV